MAVEFNPSNTKVRKAGKCVAVFEQVDGGIIVWFQAIKGTHFSEDFTADDLRAIADKLEFLENQDNATKN